MKLKAIIVLIVFIYQLDRSYAYLDPGTGAMVISSLWQVFVMLFVTVSAFVVKWFWNPIKNKIKSINLWWKRSGSNFYRRF